MNKECLCEGKYPNLEHHTLLSCYTEYGTYESSGFWLELSRDSLSKHPRTDTRTIPSGSMEWEERIDLIWERAHIPDYANDAKFVIKAFITQLLQEEREKEKQEWAEFMTRQMPKWAERGAQAERNRIERLLESKKGATIDPPEEKEYLRIYNNVLDFVLKIIRSDKE